MLCCTNAEYLERTFTRRADRDYQLEIKKGDISRCCHRDVLRQRLGVLKSGANVYLTSFIVRRLGSVCVVRHLCALLRVLAVVCHPAAMLEMDQNVGIRTAEAR